MQKKKNGADFAASVWLARNGVAKLKVEMCLTSWL
jgi:hypothetical protein